MKVVIAGSRSLNDNSKEKIAKKTIHSMLKWLDKPITDIICGEAVGPDTWGKQYAVANNLNVISMPANWQKYGKSAGPIRNKEMADIADFALILWDGESNGAKNMLDNMVKMGKPYILQIII